MKREYMSIPERMTQLEEIIDNTNKNPDKIGISKLLGGLYTVMRNVLGSVKEDMQELEKRIDNLVIQKWEK